MSSLSLTLPWNPSDQIDEEGFPKQVYSRLPGKWEGEANIGGTYSPNSQHYASTFAVTVSVRQVPGDQNCLFHSLLASLAYAVNGTHRSMVKQNKTLFLQGKEYLKHVSTGSYSTI